MSKTFQVVHHRRCRQFDADTSFLPQVRRQVNLADAAARSALSAVHYIIILTTISATMLLFRVLQLRGWAPAGQKTGDDEPVNKGVASRMYIF